MTAEDLKTARNALGLSQVELAARLETPLRTLQDWEAERRRVPGICAVAVRLLKERDEIVTRYAVAKAVAGYGEGK